MLKSKFSTHGTWQHRFISVPVVLLTSPLTYFLCFVLDVIRNIMHSVLYGLNKTIENFLWNSKVSNKFYSYERYKSFVKEAIKVIKGE